MTRLSNTFEGGTDGTAITVANSGGASGDAFNVVNLQGTGVALYDDDAGVVTGTFSGLMQTTSGVSSGAYCAWTTSWGTQTEVWCRMYVRFSDATPATATDFFRINTGNTNCAHIRITSTGTLQVRDAGSTARYTSTLALANNTTYRIEFHVVHSDTVGHMEARIFHGANLHGTTADESLGNLTDNWDTNPDSNQVRLGIVSTPGQAIDVWLDDVAADNVGWIGPSLMTATGTPVQAAQTSTASGSVTSGATGTAAITQADQTSSAIALETITGTSATTQAAQSSTATGLETVSGTSATTQAAQTSTASGLETISGTSAVAQAAQTSAASGTSMHAAGYLDLPGTPGDVASTPGGAWLTDIDGDLDLRFQVRIDDDFNWPYLLSNTGADYRWNVFTNGDDHALGFDWTQADTTYFYYPSLPDVYVVGQWRWLRVTLDVDNGAGGHTVNFYYSDDPLDTPVASVTWTLHSTDGAAGVTDVGPGTEDLWLGDYSEGGGFDLDGRIGLAEIWSKGVRVANPDFRDADQYDSPTQLTDDEGRVWTVENAAVWVLPPTGTSAVTQDDQTSTASGMVLAPVTGTAAVTQADQTSVATGVETVIGTSANTQASQTSTASGSVAAPVTGTVAVTQEDQTSTASGLQTVTGTSAAAQVDQTSTASGVVATPVTGTVAVTQADQASSAAGVETISGTSAATQASQTSTASGSVANPVAGTVAASQADQTSSAIGAVGDIIFGLGAATQASQTSTASGLETISGTAAVTQANQTSTASGLEVIAGTSATTQANQTAAASALEAITGTGAVTQADQTSTGAGLLAISGNATTTQADQVSTGAGNVVLIATGSSVQGNQTSTATGTVLDTTPTGTAAEIQDDQFSTGTGIVTDLAGAFQWAGGSPLNRNGAGRPLIRNGAGGPQRRWVTAQPRK